MEALDHLVHQVRRVRIHAVEGDGDLEGLLAVTHVDGAMHVDMARSFPAQALAPARLHLGEERAEPRPSHLPRVADVRQHELVAQIGGEHAPGREDGRHARHDDPGDLEHARDLGDVETRRAAEGEEGEAPRIGPAPHGDDADAFGHVGVDHALYALGGRDGQGAESRGEGRHRGLRAGGVEARAAAEEIGGIEQAQHDVGVGDRGRGAAQAIARGPGDGARALGTDVEDATLVDMSDGAAPRAERVDVDGGQGDLARPHRLVARQLRLAALKQRDVRGGAAHVEGDEVPVREQSRGMPATRDASRGPREHGSGGQPHGVGDSRHAAVRLHDEDVARVAGLAEPVLEPAEVDPEGGPDIGIDHGGAEALVLLDLGEDLGRERDVDARHEPLEGAPRRLLVAGVAIGMEVAHRDRGAAGALEPLDARSQRAWVERRGDLAVEADPLLHAEPARARHERNGRRHAQVVAVLLEPFAHLDHVAMSLGGQHADGGALALEEGIGRDGRAVDDEVRGLQEGAKIEAVLAREQGQALHDAERLVLGRRGGLGHGDAALHVRRDEVGEGPAHVYPDAIHA